jgi:hypothetical protein
MDKALAVEIIARLRPILAEIRAGHAEQIGVTFPTPAGPVTINPRYVAAITPAADDRNRPIPGTCVVHLAGANPMALNVTPATAAARLFGHIEEPPKAAKDTLLEAIDRGAPAKPDSTRPPIMFNPEAD